MTNPAGRFGIHGGQYVPETLMNTLIELEEAYGRLKDDPGFQDELSRLLDEYAGRPSRLYYAKKMTEDLGGARIYLKREDLNHTGAHKINNVLFPWILIFVLEQVLLYAFVFVDVYLISGSGHFQLQKYDYK